jgi:Uma2 family endonuclease
MTAHGTAAPALRTTAEDYRTRTPAFGTGARYELIAGELLPMTAPSRYHQKISGNLYRLIDVFLEDNPMGDVYAAPFDVYLDDINVFQPDLVFVSNARASILRPEGAVGAPDLVIEILSPSTARLDKQTKRPILARLGAREFWLVDPVLRQAQVYDLTVNPDQPAAVYQEGDSLQTPLLPGLVIPLRKVFAQRFV